MIRLMLVVAAGGVIGTLLRFALSTWVSTHWPRHFYLATLAVNLLGCLLIGYLYALFLMRPDVSPELRGGLILGFLGAVHHFFQFLSRRLAAARERPACHGLRLHRPECARWLAGDLGRPGPRQVMKLAAIAVNSASSSPFLKAFTDETHHA